MVAIDCLTTSVTLPFGEAFCIIGQVCYDAARQLLLLFSTEDREVLSVNLESCGLTTPVGHVWVKDLSEHAGLTNQLIDLQAATYKLSTQMDPSTHQPIWQKLPIQCDIKSTQAHMCT